MRTPVAFAPSPIIAHLLGGTIDADKNYGSTLSDYYPQNSRPELLRMTSRHYVLSITTQGGTAILWLRPASHLQVGAIISCRLVEDVSRLLTP